MSIDPMQNEADAWIEEDEEQDDFYAWIDDLGVISAPSGPADAGVREAFKFADSSDWDFLIGQLPDGGRGRFWKAVFEDVQAALCSGENNAPSR